MSSEILREYLNLQSANPIVCPGDLRTTSRSNKIAVREPSALHWLEQPGETLEPLAPADLRTAPISACNSRSLGRFTETPSPLPAYLEKIERKCIVLKNHKRLLENRQWDLLILIIFCGNCRVNTITHVKSDRYLWGRSKCTLFPL